MDLTDKKPLPLDEASKLLLVQDLCRAARREIGSQYTHRLRTLLDMALIEIDCLHETLDRKPAAV